MNVSLKSIAVLGLCLGIGFYSLLVGNAFGKEPLVIKIRTTRGTSPDHDPTKEYKYQLLHLIFNKTKKSDGPFRIESQPDWITQARSIDMVKQGYLTLIMTMTSKERERDLHPIRIPIYKGMYGYRLAIINRDDQKKFSAVKTLTDFQKLWAGQGSQWPDTRILRANGFKVVGSSRYLELFDMLKERRFDFFPRGLHEPWRELADRKDPDLVVEKGLCLHYPAPGYIFTSRENRKLVDRIERGFGVALKDGSFDDLFYNHPVVNNVIKSANLKQRRIFRLKNPLLSAETPLDQKEYWYRP
ncbi:MAG: amino acid ABC transporter substrate-binding protein [Proteobacteria bacterium]|nr:amino acid ABC transporter substrate-binding protein [Pseudomonadota bacterium]